MAFNGDWSSRIPGHWSTVTAVPRTRDEAARSRVLSAARDLICELGPRAVTVDGIAAAAGVGKQTIYRWWPSKGATDRRSSNRAYKELKAGWSGSGGRRDAADGGTVASFSSHGLA